MKEQDMIHKLVEEEIEIPERIRPENIYRQLLQMEERGEQNSRQQRGVHMMMKKAVFTGTAVAAGLLICVLAAVQGPVRSSRENNSVIQRESQPGAAATKEAVEKTPGEEVAARQDYQSVFQQLQDIEEHQQEMWKTRTMEKQIMNESEAAVGMDMATAEENGMAAKSSDMASSAETSETNVRTQGVDEGDIVKTDGEYIYAYRSGEKPHCYIYRAKQGKTKKVATISFAEAKSSNNYDIRDMYLSKGKLVLVVLRSIDSARKEKIKELYQKAGGDYKNFCKTSWGMPGYSCGVFYESEQEKDGTWNPWVDYSCTLIYDISDPSSPVLEKELFQDGIYESSRMVDGDLYLMSRRAINLNRIKSEKEKTFIPQVGGECVTPDKVDLASENEEGCYQVLSSVDVASGEYIDKKAVLGGGSQIYVSEKSIYLVNQLSWNGERTVVLKYSYQDGEMQKEAEGKIEGYLKDDYSMDERDGYLRAVTTYYNKRGTEKNAVYILNSQLKKTGEIKNIAPKESVYAVRFMGDLVYFVTFEQTDPVFVADLSDPTAPEIIGELKLPGFSSYLHPIGDDLMVGIGSINEEEEEGVKLSLFDTSNPKNIKEIHKTVLDQYNYCEVMDNPNALFVDAGRQLLGFSVCDDWGLSGMDYLVYQVDRKKGFVRQCKADVLTMPYYEMGGIRGLYIDDYFYVVNPGKKIKTYIYPAFKELF